MLNEGLTNLLACKRRAAGTAGMTKELLLAAFLIGVGLCIAGAGTHLYQWLAKQQAMLRYDGKTFAGSMGHLAMSFVCGPYIMLQMGWQHEDDGTISMTSALVSALVAFGWAFITGLMFMGAYVALRY
jgi:hypothetical protein